VWQEKVTRRWEWNNNSGPDHWLQNQAIQIQMVTDDLDVVMLIMTRW